MERNEKSLVIVSEEGSGMGEDLDHSLAYMVHCYLTMSL